MKAPQRHSEIVLLRGFFGSARLATVGRPIKKVDNTECLD